MLCAIDTAFTFGNFEFHDTVIDALYMPEDIGIDCLIGKNILSQYKVTIDYKNEFIEFQKKLALVIKLIFRPTIKAASKLKLVKLENFLSTPKPLSEWYINIFNVSREQFFMFTDTVTLFTVLFEVKGNSKTEKFVKSFTDNVSYALFHAGYQRLFEKFIMSETTHNSLYKTSNKAVLGSMKNMTLL